jgi:UMP-CMP kinase 2
VFYKLIAIEGIDWTGKTTVANLLAEEIEGVYIATPDVALKEARKYFDKRDQTAKFLFYLAGLIDSSCIIRQRLSSKNVVVDRYLATTICYHEAAGVNTSLVKWEKIPIARPDYQFCLEVQDKAEWLRRIAERDGEEEKEKTEKEYVRFMAIAKKMKNFIESQDGVAIDTSRLSPKQVVERMLAMINGGS